MCSSTTADLIQEVSREFVGQDKAFTAFEVSLEVKDRAANRSLPVERHSHIKDEIHRTLQGYVDSNVYNKTLCDVGAPTKAFLYHPPTYDPASYIPLDRKDRKTVTVVSVSAGSLPPVTSGIGLIAGPSSDDGDDNDDGDQLDKAGRAGDARGTLAVPTYILRAAQFNSADVAYVSADDRNGDQVLVLSRQLPAGHTKLTSYTVDKGNNIRITKFILDKAGVDGANGYDFECDGQSVYVKAHK